MIYTDKDIRYGFIAAENITRKYSKTFYFTSKFLPRDKRYALYAIYAICRISDDAVDMNTDNHRINALKKIRDDINLAYTDSKVNQKLISAFRETVQTYDIPKNYFDTLIEGMYMDIHKNRYENFNELYVYCYKAGGIVGLMAIKVFGYKNKEAEGYAVDLGIAIQLTNMIRDIKEDFIRNRIYLPQDAMNKFNVSQEHIAQGTMDDNFIGLIKSQINQARQYYDNSAKGISTISNRVSRLAICLIKEMYSAILGSVEKNKYDIFSKRAYVPMYKKIFLTLKVLAKGQYL
ncbi:MAG: phytoene/squalene synthase family protein [Candidatus Omnitrophica bacterium]|nr:phytoene/squalene synthase family protein [Candidatus Omnitrophota bacterium]